MKTKTTTTARKSRHNGNGSVAAPPPPPPAEIRGKDFKRAATCAGMEGKYAINHIELSPLGLTATDGRMLCVFNLPGWPYQCYIEPRDLKPVESEALLSINGAIEFAIHSYGSPNTKVQVPHKNPEENEFPKWQRVLPDAFNLQPVATLSAAFLKRLLSALQREGDSAITIFARTDNCLEPLMLANEAGDLGLLMPIAPDQGDAPVIHFPAGIYRALGRDTQTVPPVFVPPARRIPSEGQETGARSGASALLPGA